MDDFECDCTPCPYCGGFKTESVIDVCQHGDYCNYWDSDDRTCSNQEPKLPQITSNEEGS